MTNIFAGVKDEQVFSRKTERQYDYVVIGRKPAYVNIPGNENPDEWQAINWCGRLDLARKNAKAAGRNYFQVEILPVFKKSAGEVRVMKEDIERQKRAQDEALQAAEEEAARQAQEREEADDAARMEAYYNAKREEVQARFKGQDEADTDARLQELAQDPEEEEDLSYEESLNIPSPDAAPYGITEDEPDEATKTQNENRERAEWLAENIEEEPEEDPEVQQIINDMGGLVSAEDARKMLIGQKLEAAKAGYDPSLICKACGRILSGPDSIKRGYGDKCWRKVWKVVTGKTEPQVPADQKANNPDSVTDPDRAFITRLEIKKRIDQSEETCLCGERAEGAPVWFYDHDGGYMIPGYSRPQWIYAVCPKCGWQFSLRKMASVDIEDLVNEGRREAGVRLAEEEARKAAKKAQEAV